MSNEIFYYDRDLSSRAKTIRLYSYDEQKHLITGILDSEEFGINVNNKWGSNTSIIDSVINTVAGLITSSAGKMTASLVKSIGDITGVDFIKKAGQIGQKYTNAAIYSAAESLKSYQGTDIDFNGVTTLKRRFIAGTAGQNIINEITKLYPYCSGNIDNTDFARAISEWVGIQLPPNNYVWDFGNISTSGHMERTLTMFIGTLLIVDNLLVTSFKVNFSSQTVMDKGTTDYMYGSGFITGKPSDKPLYADVEIELEFARKPSLEDLKSFIRPNAVKIKGENTTEDVDVKKNK